MSIPASATLLALLTSAFEGHPPPPPPLPAQVGRVETVRVVQASGFVAVPPPAIPERTAVVAERAAEPETTPASTAVSRRAPSADAGRTPVLGVALHGGLPEGFGASLVIRPWRALRLHAGGMTNTMNSGAMAGLTLSPFFSALAPTVGVEAGLLGHGDLTAALRWAMGDSSPESLRVAGSYRFASAQLGLELGSPRRFVVYVRAGLSRVVASLEGTSGEVGTGDRSAVVDPGEMTLRLTMPSVKAGFVFYL